MATLIASGAHSAVYRRPEATPGLEHDGLDGWVAVKVVARSGQAAPHDVLSEIKILSSLRFAHIVPLIRHELDDDHRLVMPFYPLTLAALLDSRRPPFEGDERLSTALLQQMLAAVAHIHAHDIAHRDLCPSNFAIGPRGTVVLLDFSIGINTTRPDRCTDVGSAPYRAPELIYGDTAHDLRALDLWALGCTVAELFTPFVDIRARTVFDGPESEDDDDETVGYRPPWMRGKRREPEWRRQTLFDGAHGDIALAGSIFKILGTPTRETWPETARMSSFGLIEFKDFPPRPLAEVLPGLPASSGAIVALLEQMLQVSASRRTPAAELAATARLADALQPGDPSLIALLEPWLSDAIANAT